MRTLIRGRRVASLSDASLSSRSRAAILIRHRIRYVNGGSPINCLKRLASTAGKPPVLLALWEQEGFTQTELADRLKITPATVTKMLQRMEKTGFIQRKPDAKDQRVSRVYLTKAGRAIQGDVEAVWKTMQAETFANFTLEERILLRAFCSRCERTWCTRRVKSRVSRNTGKAPFLTV